MYYTYTGSRKNKSQTQRHSTCREGILILSMAPICLRLSNAVYFADATKRTKQTTILLYMYIQRKISQISDIIQLNKGSMMIIWLTLRNFNLINSTKSTPRDNQLFKWNSQHRHNSSSVITQPYSKTFKYTSNSINQQITIILTTPALRNHSRGVSSLAIPQSLPFAARSDT